MNGNLSPNNFQPLNSDTLASEASKAINLLANYYENVENYPVRSQVEPGYLREIIPDYAPNAAEPLEDILEDIRTKVIPGLTHWQSPNFFAYYQANASNAGLGDILCSGLNVVGFNWIASPAATELETIVMDWLGKMINLPQEFLPCGGGGGVMHGKMLNLPQEFLPCGGGGGGVMHGSTCEAIVCTMAAARDQALNMIGEEKITKLVVYASDQAHFCFQKAAKLVGIPSKNFRTILTSMSTNFAMSPNNLRAAMEADVAQGLIPMYVCTTIGTTPSGAIDPIDGLAQVASCFGAWLHVDAAFAGSACICPEYRHYLNGVELADSISMNPHKWLLTNMDCSCLWLKNPKSLTDSLSTNPEILKNKATELCNVIDYKDWQIALSRRFRALKLWVVIRRYGVTNLVSHIRSDIDLAKYFVSLLEKDKRFELVVPRNFSLVCFRLKSENIMNQKLLEAVNSSGQAYMTHAILGGIFAIRCAIGGSLTEKCHIDSLWQVIQEEAFVIEKMFGIIGQVKVMQVQCGRL